jgi:SRSO17 transposase
VALFVADVFGSVPRKDQRAKGDCHRRGLTLDGRRKSIQPMAELLEDGNEQNLQQFVNRSTWDPLPVRRRIAERMLPLIGPAAWAVDDVSFPRTGRCRWRLRTSTAECWAIRRTESSVRPSRT